MTRVPSIALALALLATARAAGAQAVRLADAADAAAVAACLDALPTAAFTRVAVLVAATLADSGAHGPLLPGAELLAQGVAQRLRATAERAGTPAGDGMPSGDGVPAGDALVPWRAVPATVDVMVHRDGRLAWARGDTGAVPGADTAGTALLAGALAAVHADGERVPWPDGLAGDSASFALTLAGPTIGRDGGTAIERAGRAFPAFTLSLPWAEPARMTKAARVAYPEASLRGGAEGLVRLRYVVDERGRVVRGTIAEQWPATRPRLRGDLGRFYEAFRRATERGVPTARFEPARVGGCAVPQLVQQDFAYGLRR